METLHVLFTNGGGDVGNKMRILPICVAGKTFFMVGIIVLILVFTNGPLSLISESYAHFEHLPVYNGRTDLQSRYQVYQALESDYARPQEPTAIIFSVQDMNGDDAKDIAAMIEVYASNGERIKIFPWAKYDGGDFQVPFTFTEAGSYQIVLSTANAPARLGTVDPPRNILSSTSGCDCGRSVFNVSISERFGAIWSSTTAMAVGAPLIILGVVLWLSYSRRRRISKSSPISTLEIIRYSVMLSAIAGGIVHLSIYFAHASLRLEYSVFFVIAGTMQILYGSRYILLSISGDTDNDQLYYKKSVAVNLFGFVGTVILVGLYIYTIVMPAPLSPTNMPDRIEIAGVLAKALEVFLLVGIAYIMRAEKRRTKDHLASTGQN